MLEVKVSFQSDSYLP